MLIDPKSAKLVSLAVSLPSSIFFLAWGLMKLASEGIISRTLAIILFVVFIGNTVYLMVWYAFKTKNKS